MAPKDHGTITLERDGRRYEGEWSVQRDMIKVSMRGNGSDVTQLGGHANNPDDLAMIILSELITKHLRDSSKQS
jgi:hypothetical protein